MTTYVGKLAKRCRNECNLTQIKAAIELSVSVETLGRYERNENAIPFNMLVSMSKLYDAPELLIVGNPAAITCTITKVSRNIGNVIENLTDIFSDNYVDETEQKAFKKTLSDVTEMRNAFDAILAYADSIEKGQPA